jgi:signal peptidase I
VTEPVRILTSEELVAVAALWKRTGREVITHFTGTSMQPTIADREAVTLRCADDVSIGDVVAYVYGDRVVVHRIVAIWSDRFVTRGDANVLPDPKLLERSDIIGKVVLAAPVALPFTWVASLMLTLSTFVARIAGNRATLRLLGVLRTAHRRLRA